jgi:hypothetical protein
VIAFPRELSVGSTGNTCHAAKEPTYRSAVCGPSSLHGDRTEHDCECHASRSGFKKPGPHHVSCSRCGSKMSIECLDALSAKVDELDYPLHDPEGVWAA